MNWNELSIQEKADLIKLYVANGITSLDTIKEHYNSFQDGGDTKKPRGYRVSSAIMNLAHKAVDKNAANTIDTPDNGAPQSTFLMNRKNQQKVFEDEGYTKVDNNNYGPVANAVNTSRHKDVPVYQKYPDTNVARNNLQKIGTFMDYAISNANTETSVYNGPVESYLTDPANFPVDVYIDRKTGKVYNQGWDYNDYHNIRSTTGISKLKNVAGNILDRIGNPTVVTTGLQENTIKSTEADRYLQSKNPMLSYQKNEDTGEYEIMMKPVTVTAKRTNPVKSKTELRPASEMNADEFWDMMEANSRQNGGRLYQDGGHTNNKSDWAKAHETELALYQLGWNNPDNRLHSDYAVKDEEGYYAGYRLKPVTVSAKHPIKDIEPNIKTDKKYWDDLYQQYLRREEAGKNYMKWAAPLAMSPLIPIAGPTAMKIINNPWVDAAFTADAARNLPTALGDIRDSFNEGKIGRGLLRTGETALDLWGAGKLGKTFNKAWQKAFNLNTNLGITNNIIPITRPISKNPILNYNPESLPSELEHPFFLSHTLTGKDLAKALKEGSPAPSIGIIRGNNGKPSFTYPIYADDGIYTFYFKPDYLNSKEYVATPFDMFSPTIDNAETYIGHALSPIEIVNAKRDMYNRWGTLNDLQNTVNFSSKLIENQKQFDRAVRKSQQFKSLQDVKNKMVLGSNEVYGEMMPLDLIDLEKAALVIGGGSKNSDIANFLTNMNFYELYKPHKIDNFYDIPGLAFQKGGRLGHITPYGQWQYPNQITTIPSNNITMKGVDYPVIGVSNTGDTKYMLPNMDYLFDGQYVTEYPINI